MCFDVYFNDVALLCLPYCRYRYTEFVVWNRTALAPDWNNVFSKELYDHRMVCNVTLACRYHPNCSCEHLQRVRAHVEEEKKGERKSERGRKSAWAKRDNESGRLKEGREKERERKREKNILPGVT